MVGAQQHRGPDASGVYLVPSGQAGLGHNRLSIIDLSSAGAQPMSDASGALTIVFNGEVYNYTELRVELADYPYRSKTDTEVVLAAYERWGPACVHKFIGMFAFAIWDERRKVLFAARDRFGVKPLHYHLRPDGTILMASEIPALHAAGVPASPDTVAWATYLTYGWHDHSERTFWEQIRSLPPGSTLVWKDGHIQQSRWYDLAESVGPDFDSRPEKDVAEEYLALMLDSVRLRFRSDVPVGINLSGGLDSSILLGLVQKLQGKDSDVKVFTYVTGDPAYDELPWVQRMIARTKHPCIVCPLAQADVPELAHSVQSNQAGPFGGLPTLAYARIFEHARADGELVLLDGQGMDEQWAGYDYYEKLSATDHKGTVQGSRQTSVRPECLTPWFRSLAEPFEPPQPFPDALRNRQYLDTSYFKIQRALRFNDRVSMRSSTELREPFMDHRLFELAFRQPSDRKIKNGSRKRLLREMTRDLLPKQVGEAPKRPVQTPQREWLAGPLQEWSSDRIHLALTEFGGEWLQAEGVRAAWKEYLAGKSDNSFYVWQWISIGLMLENVVEYSI